MQGEKVMLQTQKEMNNSDEILYKFDLKDLGEKFDLKEPRKVWVIFGKISGFDLENIVEAIDKTSIVFLAAMDKQYLLDMAEQFDEGQFIYAYANKPDNLAEIVTNKIDIQKYDSWNPVILKDNLLEDSQLMATFYRTLGASLNFKILNRNTLTKSNTVFFENGLINAALSVRRLYSKNSLVQSYDGRPILIMAAGPSLDKQLSLIKKYENLFRIFIVAAAYRAVDKYDIKADVVIVSDPLNIATWPQEVDKSILIDVGVDPAVAWKTPDDLILTTHSTHAKNVFDYLGCPIDYLGTGGSVATSAFMLAKDLKSNPIVLIGQDLAITEEIDHSKFHAHKISAEKRFINKLLSFEVDGYYDGSKVYCPRDFMMFKHWFENQIKSDKKTLVFNCTEGGVRIEGATQLPFEDLCIELEKFTNSRKPKYFDGYDKPLAKLSLSVLVARADLLKKDLLKLANDLKVISRKIEKPNKIRNGSLYELIDKFNNGLSNLSPQVAGVLELYSHGDVQNFLRDFSMDECSEKDIFSKKYLAIYKILISSIDQAKCALDVAVNFYSLLASNDFEERDTFHLNAEEVAFLRQFSSLDEKESEFLNTYK